MKQEMQMSKRAILDKALNYLYLAEELLDATDTEHPRSLQDAISDLEEELLDAAMEEQADKELAAERG